MGWYKEKEFICLLKPMPLCLQSHPQSFGFFFFLFFLLFFSTGLLLLRDSSKISEITILKSCFRLLCGNIPPTPTYKDVSAVPIKKFSPYT